MLNGTHCRSCGEDGLHSVLSLGCTPLADALRTPEQLAQRERTYPLNVSLCDGCGLLQIRETVPADELFCRDYPYFSSFSEALLRHSRENALRLIDSRRLNASSLVVELASNDGYLLRNFVERGIPVLGIDPAEGPARAAEKIGVPTLCTFFTQDLARKLRAEGKRADVIIVSLAAARQTPMYDPLSHLVYVTRGDDVRTTIVNGKVLMRDRKVLTLDPAAVLRDAKRWAAMVSAAVAR